MSSVQRGKYPPGKQTPVTLDGLDGLDGNVVPARPWGGWLGVGFVECAGVFSIDDSFVEFVIRHAKFVPYFPFSTTVPAATENRQYARK